MSGGVDGSGSVALGPSAYLVLGFIARLGPSTPYDLKKAVNKSIAYFWDFPISQLYVEPERLAKLGLLAEQQEQHGRRRRVFSLTDEGRDVLRAWLEAPVEKLTEVRDLGLLKLYFAGMSSPERVRQLAEEQVALHDQRLAEYDRILEDLGRHQRLACHQIPIRMGYLFEQACVSFWRSMITDPPIMDPKGQPLASPSGALGQAEAEA